ncbi:hypothetical protein A1OO_04590 [Enterovibrio norvegicus FF-33]|uniref:hypothetical protein n=1 Tax=Enterovibrio TaxID=188143 RepID=UPI00035E00A3|nr:hypothetical protein [Enterovibrio norvegicus]OEE70057.1 hypothetical protein A1OO_04590 [Enterovibrio norvegicus FF-33]
MEENKNQKQGQNEDQEEEQKRDFFRLRYLEQDMPLIVCGDNTFRVCEISENGIRLLIKNDVVPEEPIAGTIHFEVGSAEVQGKTIRREDDELVIHLFQILELKKINDEQLRLRRKYSRD